MNFGTVCVGNPVTKTVLLKNDGSGRAVFNITDVPAHLTVFPMRAAVEYGSSVPLTVQLNPATAMDLSSSVTLHIRGRAGPKERAVRLHVSGDAIVPDVTILQKEVDFAGVTLGGSASQLVSFDNVSDVTCVLFLDLSRYVCMCVCVCVYSGYI
jgi:hypothetical protein